MEHERPLYSIEAEHGVLGALMLKPELAEKIGSFLQPIHFSNDDNATLYTMILAERSKGRSPDPITLHDYRPELPSGCMTIAYAADIQRNVPSAANGVRYAKVIHERYKARQLQDAAFSISEIATTTGSIAEQVAKAQSLLMSLAAEDERPDVVTMGSLLQPIIDRIDNHHARDRNKPAVIEGVRFGLKPIDDLIKSMRPGNMVVVAGRPGTGKTVLGLNAADNVAMVEKKGVLVFSLEMEGNELARRAMSATSGVLQDTLDCTRDTVDDDWPKLTSAVNALVHADYRLCEKPGLPFSRICSIARYQHRVQPLSLIVIDYIGLVTPEPGSKLFNRAAELGVVSRGIKALAKELKLPIIVLAQLNRGIEGRAIKTPQMSDLRDCGDIEQDADIIIFAHRDESTDEGRNGITDIYVPKVRHGKTGHCQLQFHGEVAKFSPAKMKYYGDTEAKPAKRQTTSDWTKRQSGG